MSRAIGLSEELRAYVARVGIREHPVLTRLREENLRERGGSMQVAPEEGALLALLVRLIGARRVLEVGTFTGYSSTAMALALPPGGRVKTSYRFEGEKLVVTSAWAASPNFDGRRVRGILTWHKAK